MEILGFVLGFLYLWLELRASIYLWIVGAIMPAVYAVVYFEAGLYADGGIQIYYILAAVYGWWAWAFSKGEKKDLPISSMPLRCYLPLVLVALICFGALAVLLLHFTDSTVPYSDAFTTALSIAAMWMLSRKYVEQWLVWCFVDVLYVFLYIYKDLYFTAVLYAVYALIAVYGYFDWKRRISAQ
ncbi:MAG: nicotinamide mononucleotide transporter [Bacteroidaceae bacterium]|nr:nicotinamide mononucleotide transporter [Bacteroidaceae bacterium]MBR6482709.1 nicotinamide mononucleotide transporter [Bacteroidaceae bacterium]